MALFAWKTTRVAAITSGGPNQDITISGIGTPLAVIIEVTNVVTAGTGATHAILSCGAADGTTEANIGLRMKDAGTTNDTGRRSGSDGLVLILNSGDNNIDGQAHWNSWITDGVRITWDNLPASAYLLTVTFIYGTLAHASVVLFATSGVSGGTDAIGGLGYDPNVAMFWWNRLAASSNPSTPSDDASIHFGVAVDNEGTIEQGTMGLFNIDNRSINKGCAIALRDDCVLQRLEQLSDNSVTYTTRLQVENFVLGSGGLNVKTVNGSDVFDGFAVVLDVGLNRRRLLFKDFDTDTTGSTGSAKLATGISASGSWKPKLARAVSATALSVGGEIGTPPPLVVNPGAAGTGTGYSLGWASNQGGVSQFFVNGIRANSAATVDTQSHTDDLLVDVPSGNTTWDWKCTVSSWDSDGVRVNVTDASALDRYTMILLIEEDRIANSYLDLDKPHVRLAAPKISGTGTVRFQGSGQIKVSAPDFNGTGTERISGSGQIRAAAPDFLGSGSETISGSGQIRASAADFAGSGVEIVAGSGQLRAAAPDFDGSGSETITGSGQVRVAAPDFNGSGALIITGSGQLRVEAPDFAGSGVEIIAGSGQLRVGAPDFNGSGAETISGSGQLRVEAPDFAGSGLEIISGSGQLRVEAPSFNGSGALTITGSGQLRVEAADFSGVGLYEEIAPTGVGQLRVSAPILLGSGVVVIIEFDIGCTEDYQASYDLIAEFPASHQAIVAFGASHDLLVELAASHDLVVDLAASYDGIADFPASIC